MRLFFLLFLCLPVLAGRELVAQSKNDSLQKTISKSSHNIVAPMMSDNGSWLTLRKRGWMPAWEERDLDKDTVMIFDLRESKVRIAATRYKIRSMAFIGNSHLLLSNELQTELLNLNEQKSIYFWGVQRFQVLKNEKFFILHYNNEEKNRLELHESNGELLNSMNNVNRFYITETDLIFAITYDKKNVHEIFRLKDEIWERVYFTKNKIVSLEADAGEKGIMIYEQIPESPFQEILYLDLTTRSCFPLKEALPVPLQKGFSEAIREGSIYLLRLVVHQKKKDTSFVDIWYGNDNQVEEKFYPLVQEVCYVWEPYKNRVQRIGTDKLIKNANIGNERYYLSFDPYHLRDFTKPARLIINIYDRLENQYNLMDTIPKELHVSPDGQFILYPKNKAWYIYYIATGIKKIFGDNKLQVPFFTHNIKTVLFSGEGGLWVYNVEENKLSKSTNFEGAEVTILNISSGFISGGINFYQKTVDLTRPLVINLYYSQNNENTYVLCKNGKSQIIVPSTGRHIQYLKYDNACKRFSYIEENYNMPPRLVFKKPGEKEKVIYQSNQADKAILSLKQEIISYTNCSGIPLKGILYYPLHYTSSKKYPMVLHIYEKQHQLANLYPYSSYYEELGFNIRILLENGYFVYLPDIFIQGKDGPGMDALDCVNNALNALAGNSLINKNKIGLIGHSFGGYETDFIATHSNRFAAYVSGSGHSDILWAYHAFNYNFLNPDYIRIESGIYNMGISFSGNKTLYLRNNPIFKTENVNAPVLLWTGLEDQNVTSDHSMAFYNALRRNGKEVIALFYKNEGHNFRQQQSQSDLTLRILDWFDYFLKNDTKIEWIGKRVEKKDAP